MEHSDAIADVLHIGQQMGRHDHRLAPPLEIDDEILHLAGADRIETAGRFDEQHQFRVVDQRLRHPDAACHALGIFLELPLFIAPQADHLDQRRSPTLPLLRRHVEEPAVEIERLFSVEKFVEVRFLGEVANPLVLRNVGRLPAKHQRFAGGGEDEPQKELHSGGFARAVGAEQPENFPATDLQIERLESHLLAATPEVPINL